MLCIESSAQNAFVYSRISGEAWLGYSDAATEGIWEWNANCDSTYENWAGSQPDNYGGDEDYAVIWTSTGSQWGDWGMGYASLECICQQAPTPAPTPDTYCAPASSGACLEYNWPTNGAWNTDNDCCAVCNGAACADGYTFVGQIDVDLSVYPDFWPHCSSSYCGNTCCVRNEPTVVPTAKPTAKPTPNPPTSGPSPAPSLTPAPKPLPAPPPTLSPTSSLPVRDLLICGIFLLVISVVAGLLSGVLALARHKKRKDKFKFWRMEGEPHEHAQRQVEAKGFSFDYGMFVSKTQAARWRLSALFKVHEDVRQVFVGEIERRHKEALSKLTTTTDIAELQAATKHAEQLSELSPPELAFCPPDLSIRKKWDFFFFEPADQEILGALRKAGAEKMNMVGYLLCPAWFSVYGFCFLLHLGSWIGFAAFGPLLWLFSGGNQAFVELVLRITMPTWLFSHLARNEYYALKKRAADYFFSVKGLVSVVLTLGAAIWIALGIAVWYFICHIGVFTAMCFVFVSTGFNTQWTSFLCQTMVPPSILYFMFFESADVLSPEQIQVLEDLSSEVTKAQEQLHSQVNDSLTHSLTHLLTHHSLIEA